MPEVYWDFQNMLQVFKNMAADCHIKKIVLIGKWTIPYIPEQGRPITLF